MSAILTAGTNFHPTTNIRISSMQQDYKTERDKALLRLERERKQLRRQLNQMVTIDPPIQRGWVRRWRLTPRTKVRPDAEILTTILSGINNEQYFWRRSFKRGKHARRWKFHRVTNQGLRLLHERDWQRLGWPEKWKQWYFRRTESTGWQGRRAVTYRFLREDLFELYTARHFITELPLHQPEVESRRAEVDSGIGYDGAGRLCTLHGGRSYSRDYEDERHHARRRRDLDCIHRALRGDWEAEKNRRSDSVPLSFRSRPLFRNHFPFTDYKH